MRRQPPHILVTTPESLYILLTSEGGRAMLANVGTAIVDEIHAVAGNKRGAHLALSLERLDALAGQPRHPHRPVRDPAPDRDRRAFPHRLRGGAVARVHDRRTPATPESATSRWSCPNRRSRR